MDQITPLPWIYDLYRLGQNAAQEGDTTAVYQQLLIHVVHGFSAKSGSLALCDNTGTGCNLLTIVAGIDLPIGVVGSKVELGEGVLGWVTKEAKALLLNGDASNDPRFQLLHGEGHAAATSSAICWPLKMEDRVIGAISVNRPGDMPSFTEIELESGTSLLGMVSLALTML